MQIVSDHSERKATVTASRLEPTVLMAEANHRIANNLTLVAGWLRLQSVEVTKSGRELSADAAGLLLDEACARIDTVSRLHRLLAGV